jgi:hypothetical protein
MAIVSVPIPPAQIVRTVQENNEHKVIAVLEDDVIDRIAQRVVELLREAESAT